MEMHEALISRGAVSGHPLQDRIMSRYNCVLLCSACHRNIIGLGGDVTFEKLARHLVEFEGYSHIRNWLFTMTDVFPTVGKQALTRFDGLKLENS